MPESFKFAYLTDTHFGAGKDGYHLQPRHLIDSAELFDRLANWIADQDLSFVVHGGDIVDDGTEAEIENAVDLCRRLPVPTYLALGNHDLAQPDSITHWRNKGTDLLPGGRDCFSVDAGTAALYVVGHHWNSDTPYFWDKGKPQQPQLSVQQIKAIDAFLDGAQCPVIVVTHAPLNAVSTTQTGGTTPFHPPYSPYVDNWTRLGQKHSNLQLVLTGHNHAHSNFDQETFTSCTTAAFGEIPAQVRLISIDSKKIHIETISLAYALGLSSKLTQEYAWCVGPVHEHSLSIPLNGI